MFRSILYLFLIGHVLGDFYLQSTTMATGKNKSFKELIKHCGLYLVAMLLVAIPIFSWTTIMYAGAIAITHFVIDVVKFLLRNSKFTSGREIFIYIIDQLLHIFIVIVAAWVLDNSVNQIGYIGFINSVVAKTPIDIVAIIQWALVTLVIIKPVSVTIKTVLNRYRPETDEEKEGLPNAGALIGILERCIILALLFAEQYSAIGFVLTAKSVARYNKMAENPKFSEYYLLGTLLSTLLVIVAYFAIL